MYGYQLYIKEDYLIQVNNHLGNIYCFDIDKFFDTKI